MKRSEISPLPAYFDRYILLNEDISLADALNLSLAEIEQFPLEKWETIGDKTYAPDKWTIKDILQHIIDTERIFTYRALCFARNEVQVLPSYSEDEYAAAATTNRRSLQSLIQELKALRLATIALFQSFSPEMLQKCGMGFKGEYSVAAIGFILSGHQRWHLKIIIEKYEPLIYTLSGCS